MNYTQFQFLMSLDRAQPDLLRFMCRLQGNETKNQIVGDSLTAGRN